MRAERCQMPSVRCPRPGIVLVEVESATRRVCVEHALDLAKAKKAAG